MAKKKNTTIAPQETVSTAYKTLAPKSKNYKYSYNNSGLGVKPISNQNSDTLNSLKNQWNTNKIIEQWRTENMEMIPDDGNPQMIGTSIPFIWSMISNIITNPDPVSISEYKKMKDGVDVLQAGLVYLYSLIIEKFGTYQHKNKKYEAFIQEMFNTMNRPFYSILEEMLSAIWAGFYVGEKQYEFKNFAWYITDVRPRPQQSIMFAVDSQGILLEDGIIQYFFNSSFAGYGNLFSYNGVMPNGTPRPNPYAPRGKMDYPWRTSWVMPVGALSIPRAKCVHFAFKGCDSIDQPYGISQLGSAYDWYLKRCSMPNVAYNAAYFRASPIPVIAIDPDQANTDDGQTFMDEVNDAFANLGSASSNPFISLWGRMGSSATKDQSVWIQELKSTANLDELVNLMKYIDSRILTAILFPSELMGLSDKGSYALGESQKDLIGRAIDFYIRRVRSAVIEDIVKQTLYINFGETKDFGEFTTEYNVSEDIALNVDKIKTTTSLGLELTPESYLNMLNIPVSSLVKFHKDIFMTDVGQDAQTYGSTATFNKGKSLGN